MSLKIIRAGTRHLEAICKIESLCFKNPWSKSLLAQEIANPDSAVFVAADEKDQIVGFSSMLEMYDAVHVSNIAVLPEYRGKKYSKKLLEALICESHERGYKNITLEVRISNTAAIGLYERYGFTKDAVRRQYYDDGEDAWIMWLRMGENAG